MSKPPPAPDVLSARNCVATHSNHTHNLTVRTFIKMQPMYTYNIISGVFSILLAKHFLKVISVDWVNGMNEITYSRQRCKELVTMSRLHVGKA